MIIKIATTYNGYTFYLPAFIDFRGRIYRSGILNYHERHFARSLMMFDIDNDSYNDINIISEDLSCSAAFKYKKFTSNKQAEFWFNEN